ncbi:amidohydrolase [Melghirimyces profundicolus]|uniref:Amidohydrolase n=1 Tax=Melghirimyces profundicolus TaxID=1242148 RepID=A0A2T6C8Q5_9BACL|nr:amidohydrolase [Melghirimyces profundicolus]
MDLTISLEQIRALQPEVIQWRRYLHQHPELSFQEKETARFVHEQLTSFGNLEVFRPTSTSVVARLKGGRPGPVLAMRADMDALPIQEENRFEFVSKNPGVMHACGHDGHTSMLLAVAKLFSRVKEEIPGEIRFIFQHAEEQPPGGAAQLVEAGVMDGVDRVIGTHLWSPLETGKAGVVYGPAMAGINNFHITVRGRGGHAAMPQQTVDSIAVGAQVVSNLQHIVARNTDPLASAVLSVTKFIGGNTHNVIPGTVEIEGTIRTLDVRVREEVFRRMEQVVKGITEAHGAAYDFRFQEGYLPVINSETVTRVVEETAKEMLGNDAVVRLEPTMGSEDFSAYQQKAPGTFFFIGAGNEEKESTYPHHHPRFTIDEDALENGIKILAFSALRLLKEPAFRSAPA